MTYVSRSLAYYTQNVYIEMVKILTIFKKKIGFIAVIIDTKAII